jgi:hypothetical protein
MSLPMEKNEKYILQKKEYNSKLSTFQISKELHKKVKEYCSKEKLKVRDFIEKLLSENISGTR